MKDVEGVTCQVGEELAPGVAELCVRIQGEVTLPMAEAVMEAIAGMLPPSQLRALHVIWEGEPGLTTEARAFLTQRVDTMRGGVGVAEVAANVVSRLVVTGFALLSRRERIRSFRVESEARAWLRAQAEAVAFGPAAPRAAVA